MKIIADKDIPLAEYLFSHIGDVGLIDGRQIKNDDLRDADMLLVRTITPVSAQLLNNTSVKFVASATSGIDHVDVNYLDNQGIAFAHALGCNARSVAEYVLSAIFVLADQEGFDPREKTVGIIGCGHVGSKLQHFLQAIGIQCLLNDPPLKDASGDSQFCGLSEIQGADIISVHVPLIEEGKYATRGLIDDEFLSQLKSNAILLNTSRGDVLDENDLLDFIGNNPKAKVVLDVWANEPEINLDLLRKVSISTPHIAGYSLDSKLRATQTIFRKACEYSGLPCDETLARVHFAETESELTLVEIESDFDAIQMAVLASYDVRSDSASLRRELEISDEARPRFFDELRKTATTRRELAAMTINIPNGNQDLGAMLLSLGFKTAFIQ